MSALDWDKLDALDACGFQEAAPYPHVTAPALIRPQAYERLCATLPGVDQFEGYFGIKRSHRQRSHDRYVLNYNPELELSEPWREFVDEIQGDRYAGFLRRLFEGDFIGLSLHWHYTPDGCEVSPHCDAPHKLGSHIFYFNTDADWDPGWGGDTLVLDDGGRFSRRSAPEFGEFEIVHTGASMGNNSLLFERRGNSWHGVRPIACPEDRYRKVFIIVVNGRRRGLLRRATDTLRGKSAEGYQRY